MASATGKNVMPSPYGRQRPRMTSAPRSPARNSSTRRDLPGAGGTQHREQLTGAVRDRALVGLLQERPLPFASDHRRVQPTGSHRGQRGHLQEPVGGDRRGLALQRERLDRLREDCVLDEAERWLTDQDLARGGCRLQPGRGVHRVPHERLVLRAHEELAGRDPDPAGKRDRRALGERRQPISYLACRSDGPERVVLVKLRDPEDRHDGISDKLLDATPVPFDRRTRFVEVAPQERGVGPRDRAVPPEPSTHEIAEQDRDRLALLPRRRRSGNRSRAGHAEHGIVRILSTAVRTGQHLRSLSRRSRRSHTLDAAQRSLR